ncbi:nucleoside triphosphate pyrophosphohydrolase [Thorsellia kenyensis]|uniref:Nucleoside triphosphate pyrophosphohydrolase n=1 Tax=Thorsellia kenyensis TaxID=1549888 RepID=A0ABV6C7M1_9GAMM
MNHLTSSEKSAIFNLLDIMTRLRDKNNGCPWDIKQTFDSLIGCTIEEVYEVKDAIENKNMHELKEELGDLLFQIVFYAQLAKESGEFNFEDICQTVAEKLIRRHPHIFDSNGIRTDDPNNVDLIKARWENIKQHERQSKNLMSLMDDIPKSLPSLLRAYKIQKRCKSVGFDWTLLNEVFAKVEEELLEVKETIQLELGSDRIEEELGDLLFAIVNLTRHLGFNPELTLDKANQKFMHRFRQVEQIISLSHESIDKATLQEMEKAWSQVKQNEN